ncbi:MAG: zinc ribbon domain-containing protein [Candidatus Planktophila sp.]
MKASHHDQQAILEVQRLDDQLASLAQREATLPESAALNATTIKRNNVRDLRIAAETERTDVKRELSRAEGDVEQIVTRIQRDEARLNSGTGTAKELEQTQHELVTLGQRRAELEEAELAIMVQVDGITNRINELSSEEEQLNAEIAELEIKKENALTIIINERSAVAEKRAAIAAPIAQDLKDLYAKLAADNNGNGAAPLVGNECKGCHLTINTTEVQRISTLPADEVVRCEQCRCILVRE